MFSQYLATMRIGLISLSVLFPFVLGLTSSEHVAPSEGPDEHDDLTGPAGTSAQEQESSSLYFPWTHMPICTAHQDENDRFCAYTNASFSNGRGISIFTTPAIAEEFASLPPFQDPTALLSKGINQNPEDRPWYVASVPGKGKGMFASRPLVRGDLIAAYTPYLLANIEELDFSNDRETLLRFAVDQLPPASRDAYLDLAKIYDDPDVVVQDVLKANAFNIKVGGKKHAAIFPEAARINHVCGPKYVLYLSPCHDSYRRPITDHL
jgi:hypothetical protein